METKKKNKKQVGKKKLILKSNGVYRSDNMYISHLNTRKKQFNYY